MCNLVTIHLLLSLSTIETGQPQCTVQCGLVSVVFASRENHRHTYNAVITAACNAIMRLWEAFRWTHYSRSFARCSQNAFIQSAYIKWEWLFSSSSLKFRCRCEEAEAAAAATAPFAFDAVQQWRSSLLRNIIIFVFFFLFLLILFELVSKYILLICLAWARAEWKALLLVRCSSYVACHRVRRHSDVLHTERMTACGGTDNILMHFAYPNAMLILWDEHTWECYDWLNII